jgi:hypothetical protein
LHPLEAPGLPWRTEKAFDIRLYHIAINPLLEVEGEVTNRL